MQGLTLLLLKDTKASLEVQQIPRLLSDARNAGVKTTITYIVGLDPIDVAEVGLAAIGDLFDLFPNLQIYQAHTDPMRALRTNGAERLAFFLDARLRFEQIFEPLGLRPVPWRNYRPLWHYQFAGAPVFGPRI